MQGLQFGGVGRDQVEIAALLAVELTAQLFVTVHQGDFHRALVTLLEGGDQVFVGIAWPAEDAQRGRRQGR